MGGLNTRCMVSIMLDLIAVRRVAESGAATFASQGQAMSGLEELYTYRQIADRAAALSLRSEPQEEPGPDSEEEK